MSNHGSNRDAARPTRRRRLLFAAIPSVVVLLLLEGAARIHESVTSNRVTLTDPAEIRRREGETLVYVYGESTVWGFPVTEVGLVAQMQYLAERRHPGMRIRIVNLGTQSVDSALLRDFVADTVGNRPDLAIVLCGHNEFLRAGSGRIPPGPLAHVALARWISTAYARTAFPFEDVTSDGLTVPFPRPSAAFDERVAIYRQNMQAMVRCARDDGVPVLVATLASNLLDWPPVFRRLAREGRDPAYEPAMETGLAADARGDAAALRSIVVAWEARAPDDAMVRFLRGRLRLSQGDRAGALADLRFARDADPIPCRMPTALSGVVSSLARDESTLFADLDQAVSRGQITGSDLVVDNCHPSPEGARRMALELLRTAESAGAMPAASDPREPRLEEFLAAAGCVPGSPLRLRLLLENGKYAMRRPFHHFPIAERHLVQAVTEYPSSWEARANLATALLSQRRTEEGLTALREAEALHGGPLDLTDKERLPNLDAVLRALGMR